MSDVALAGERGRQPSDFRFVPMGELKTLHLKRVRERIRQIEAAIKGIRNSSPLDPLPAAFKGPFIVLRFVFTYNMPVDQPLSSACTALATGTPSAPPFDRLEFLAFASANFDVPYAKQTICQRGIEFNPDSTALQIFRINNVTPVLVATASNLKPRPASNPSPDRERAFVTLQLALEDIRGGQQGAVDFDYKRSLELAGDSACCTASSAVSHKYP